MRNITYSEFSRRCSLRPLCRLYMQVPNIEVCVYSPLKLRYHVLPVGRGWSARKDLMLNRTFESKNWLGQWGERTYTKLDVVSIKAMVTTKDLTWGKEFVGDLQYIALPPTKYDRLQLGRCLSVRKGLKFGKEGSYGQCNLVSYRSTICGLFSLR